VLYIEGMELYINIAYYAKYIERVWSTYSSDSSDTAMTTTTVITLYRCRIANIRIVVYYASKSDLQGGKCGRVLNLRLDIAWLQLLCWKLSPPTAIECHNEKRKILSDAVQGIIKQFCYPANGIILTDIINGYYYLNKNNMILLRIRQIWFFKQLNHYYFHVN